MPFGNIGVGGLLLILLIALLIFGPSKLPELGRAFGRTLSEFRSATRGLIGSGTDGTDAGDAEAAGGKAPAARSSSAMANGTTNAREAAAGHEAVRESAGAADANAVSASAEPATAACDGAS